MLSHHRNVLFSIITFTIMIVIFIGRSEFSNIQAQEVSPKTMSQLLVELNNRIKEEPGFGIGFSFVKPLLDDEFMWSIPFSDREFGLERWIGDVGEDFICFFELAGQAEIVRCTPFSNIAGITYLNNP